MWLWLFACLLWGLAFIADVEEEPELVIFLVILAFGFTTVCIFL